jgi:type II secretory pathway pseudopilin PulG
MNRRDKASSYPSRKRSNPGRLPASGENGYALLIVMMMVTLLLVSMTVALPNIYVEGQREKEEELIFRGEQYARAIALFHTQFNRYPTSIKELLHTNNMSFLRRPFRDPMSKSGEWRFIHATANGVILDSKTLNVTGQPTGTNNGASNTKPVAGGGETTGATSTQNAPGSSGFSLFGGQQTGPGPAQNGQGNQGFSLFGGQQTGPGTGQPGQPNQGFSLFGEKNNLVGAYIVGVASTSTKPSIRVFEAHHHYDMWEFLGIPGAPGGPAATLPVGAPSGQQSPAGQTPQLNPQSNSGQILQPGSMFGGNSNPH